MAIGYLAHLLRAGVLGAGETRLSRAPLLASPGQSRESLRHRSPDHNRGVQLSRSCSMAYIAAARPRGDADLVVDVLDVGGQQCDGKSRALCRRPFARPPREISRRTSISRSVKLSAKPTLLSWHGRRQRELPRPLPVEPPRRNFLFH